MPDPWNHVPDYAALEARLAAPSADLPSELSNAGLDGIALAHPRVAQAAPRRERDGARARVERGRPRAAIRGRRRGRAAQCRGAHARAIRVARGRARGAVGRAPEHALALRPRGRGRPVLLHRVWGKRFNQQPELRATWVALVSRYGEWLRSGRKG